MFWDTERFARLAEGAILGFAVGDALGVPAEFMERSALRRDPVQAMRSGGVHGQPAGTWSDDTSMTLCAMDSLIAAGIDYDDLMRRFSDWLLHASNTAHGTVFDVGNTCRRAIFAYADGADPLACGQTEEFACGNGSLMRVLPMALYLAGRFGAAQLDDCIAGILHDTSKCTHAHPRCQMACGIYCAVAFALCRGGSLNQAVQSGILSSLSYYREKAEFAQVAPEFEALIRIERRAEAQIESTGYVLHTLEAALWCLSTTRSYQACVCKAVNLGGDADTTAAVAGGLAGLWYGEAGIPREWAEATAGYAYIRARCSRFAAACLCAHNA